MAITLSGDTGLAGAATGALNGTLGATTPSTVVATTIKGATTIAVGNTTPAASGAGITFPATQSASTDANTLDDYETGTWTPALKFGGGTTGLTYKNTRGVYTKIGSLVTIHGFFELTAKGSSSGSATITLPFSPNTYGNPDEPGINGLANAYAGMSSISGSVGFIIGNIGAAGYFSNGGTASTPYLSETNFSNTSWITFSATYRVA